MTDLADAIATMKRLAPARDRRSDPGVRIVSLTDDQALAVLQALHTLESIMTDDAIHVMDAEGNEVTEIMRTKTGRVLRESDIAAFVDEADDRGTSYPEFQ